MRVARFPNFFPDRSYACGFGWRRALAGLVFAVACACPAQDGPPAAAQAGSASAPPQAPVSLAPDAKPQTGSLAQPSPQLTAPAAGEARKKQISDQSTQLLAMALALKAEVDKTSKDTLSLNVIRKADEIERLAKTVKDKMKQGSGPS